MNQNTNDHGHGNRGHGPLLRANGPFTAQVRMKSRVQHIPNLRGRSGQSGFTIMEVLVAVAILGLAYVAVLQNFSLSMRNIVRVGDSRTAVFEKSMEMEKLLAVAEEDDSASAASGERPVLLEGKVFNVVVVTDTDGELTSLKLEKK